MPRQKEPVNPIFAQRMKTILLETNLTQTSLSEMTSRAANSKGNSYGVNQRTISKIVLGKQRMTLETAYEIHRVLPQYDIDWILGESEYKNSDEINTHRIKDTWVKYGEHFEQTRNLLDVFINLSELSGFRVKRSNFSVLDELASGDPEEEILILSERDTKKNVRLKAHEALNLTNGICSMIKSVIQEKIRWNSTLREDTEQREIYNNSDERL